MRRDIIEDELRDLPIGRTRMIAWEAVTRWSEDSYEVGTWGVLILRKSLRDTLDKLCALRHITEVAS